MSSSGSRASLPAAAPASSRSPNSSRRCAGSASIRPISASRSQPAKSSMHRGGWQASSPCPQVLTAWERVYRVLRDALSAGALSSRQRRRAASSRRRRSVTAHFSDGSRSRRRSPGRRRRPSLHHPPAMPAGARAALCRLCGLARAHSGGGISARDPSRAVRLHDVLPAAGRAVPGLSGGRSGQRSAPGPPPLQRGLVPPRRRSHRAAAAAHRRERHDPCRSRSRRR